MKKWKCNWRSHFVWLGELFRVKLKQTKRNENVKRRKQNKYLMESELKRDCRSSVDCQWGERVMAWKRVQNIYTETEEQSTDGAISVSFYFIIIICCWTRDPNDRASDAKKLNYFNFLFSVPAFSSKAINVNGSTAKKTMRRRTATIRQKKPGTIHFKRRRMWCFGTQNEMIPGTLFGET